MIAAPTAPPRRWASAFLAAPALALLLAACSSADAPAAPASSAPPTVASSDGGSSDDVNAARDAYDLQLAQCMRERGLDIKDPAPGEGITETGPEVNAAASACMEELGDPPLYQPTEEEAAAMHESDLARAACLRELGYDVPDPKNGEPLVISMEMPEEDFLSCEPGE